MSTSNQRSTTLRRHQDEIAKLTKAANEAFLAAEDALTAIEDREQRRAGRTTAAQDRLAALRDRT